MYAQEKEVSFKTESYICYYIAHPGKETSLIQIDVFH